MAIRSASWQLPTLNGVATQRLADYDREMQTSSLKTALRGLDVRFFDVDHAGEIHRVQIKRVATARRFTLRVRAATRDAVLTMPPRGSLPRAKLFVERHAAWIGARLERLPDTTPFGPGSAIPLRGIIHEIVHRPGMRGLVCLESGIRRRKRPAAASASAARPLSSRGGCRIF